MPWGSEIVADWWQGRSWNERWIFDRLSRKRSGAQRRVKSNTGHTHGTRRVERYRMHLAGRVNKGFHWALRGARHAVRLFARPESAAVSLGGDGE